MPTRPSIVPENAQWAAHDREWVDGVSDDNGRKHGLTQYYREDGTLCCATLYEHGKPQGPFTRYHENGEPSRTGNFVDGELHGTNVFTRSTEQTSETPVRYYRRCLAMRDGLCERTGQRGQALQ